MFLHFESRFSTYHNRVHGSILKNGFRFEYEFQNQIQIVDLNVDQAVISFLFVHTIIRRNTQTSDRTDMTNTSS